MKKSIFDFFQLDLKNIPDNTFVQAETETNNSGVTVESFRKNLDYKECGLFDSIEVKVIGGIRKNVILGSFQPEKILMENLRNLIDELYLIYGKDSENRGRFSNKDIEEYMDPELNVLFGRNWMDSPKHKYWVLIDRDENAVFMTVLGVEKE
ncbi:hypothetical protein JNM05_01805 [bacterium]|nr:hypothetical protein [bacterium]